MYVTAQDPIGLEGGSKLYGYVKDPNAWVDAFGLDPIQTLADRGFSGVVKNSNGGLDYSGSNAMHSSPNAIQKINYTGDEMV